MNASTLEPSKTVLFNRVYLEELRLIRTEIIVVIALIVAANLAIHWLIPDASFQVMLSAWIMAFSVGSGSSHTSSQRKQNIHLLYRSLPISGPLLSLGRYALRVSGGLLGLLVAGLCLILVDRFSSSPTLGTFHLTVLDVAFTLSLLTYFWAAPEQQQRFGGQEWWLEMPLWAKLGAALEFMLTTLPILMYPLFLGFTYFIWRTIPAFSGLWLEKPEMWVMFTLVNPLFALGIVWSTGQRVEQQDA
jgi:hypothetical protein